MTKYEVIGMKKKYEAPCFEEIKYNSEDVLWASDNKVIDASDPSGFGRQTNID